MAVWLETGSSVQGTEVGWFKAGPQEGPGAGAEHLAAWLVSTTLCLNSNCLARPLVGSHQVLLSAVLAPRPCPWPTAPPPSFCGTPSSHPALSD